MKKKIYVVGTYTNYASWINDAELVGNISSADIILFTGGEDVSPTLYGCKKHPTTMCNPERDNYEKNIFSKVKANQLCLGICRGSQFLCVMNGGKLVQNCNNHGIWGTHPISFANNMQYEITSTHHQMQYPYCLNPSEYKLLAVANQPTNPLGTVFEGDKIKSDFIRVFGEPEIVLYTQPKKPKCLAIQGHPEMMRPTSPTIKMLNELLDRILIGNDPASLPTKKDTESLSPVGDFDPFSMYGVRAVAADEDIMDEVERDIRRKMRVIL